MTENEASFILTNIDRRVCDDELNDALDMAIKALEQQPCEDCISREATIDAIYEKYIGGKDAIKNAPINDLYADGLAEAVDAVWELPSVTPKAKIGKWITWKEAGNEIPSETRFECSVCHDAAQTLCNGLDLLSSFCPNCGAKMTESEGER